MKILYFGPIAPEGRPSLGGFEAANRKNINTLRGKCVEVVEFPNPRINHDLGLLGKLAYLKLYLYPFKLFAYRSNKCILHITPLCGNDGLLHSALTTVRVAKKLGIKVLVDIRAGSLKTNWANGSLQLRRHLRELLAKADSITVEGTTYIGFIRDVIGIDKTAIYFPNLADCKHLPHIHKPTGQFNIFYFGRITGDKGIDVMLDCIKRLDDRFKLYLAGPLGNDISKKDISTDEVEYLGLLTPLQLQETMKRMHFFIFPSRHAGEGQSNSLIEAMSNGLIPIASEQGFNAEVVADCGRVLPRGSNGQDYADVILDLSTGNVQAMAEACQMHIKECHNLDKEISKLIGIYKNMI